MKSVFLGELATLAALVRLSAVESCCLQYVCFYFIATFYAKSLVPF